MLAGFCVYWLTMMLIVSAGYLPMEWRFASDLMRHCVYYDALDDLPDSNEGWHGLSQIVPYCIRSASIEPFPLAPATIEGTLHSFEELRQGQIRSEQLYSWSAPIDLAECYQLYLDNHIESSCPHVFYNCTRPWFGELCQYRFEEDGSLADYVKFSFLSKNPQAEDLLQVTNLSCYVYLRCRVGPAPMCLDWRDICDGKIDCLGDNIDERDCVELEKHICSDDEFQCHNGQCIPIEFFADDSANPDC